MKTGHIRRAATLSVSLCLIAATSAARGSDDPCKDYGSALAYTRSTAPEPVDLTLIDERTLATLTIRIPKTFISNAGSLSSGKQCRIWVEMFWPNLSPAGPTDFNARQVRDRPIGDSIGWRPLTIAVHIEPRTLETWFATSRYCGDRLRLKELEQRPFGLRALDDKRRWPSHRQADGTYRNMQELATSPLREAHLFYFVDGDASDMVRIHCSRGAPRCQMETSLGGMASVIFFNQEDLQKWRDVRSKVTKFIDQHTISKQEPKNNFPRSSFANSDPRRIACMREMQAISGKDGQIPGLDVGKY